MKVRIETEKAASLYGCAIGDERGLERRDAQPLLDSGDVSELADEATTAAPRKRKPARRKS
jgi:hypothetical protein